MCESFTLGVRLTAAVIGLITNPAIQASGLQSNLDGLDYGPARPALLPGVEVAGREYSPVYSRYVMPWRTRIQLAGCGCALVLLLLGQWMDGILIEYAMTLGTTAQTGLLGRWVVEAPTPTPTGGFLGTVLHRYTLWHSAAKMWEVRLARQDFRMLLQLKA
jgi:hypothetical protein